MKTKPWNQRWFAGAAFSLVFLLFAYVLLSGSFQSMERVIYDTGLRMNGQAPAVDVAVVAIDDQSIENLGRWPWSRTLLADMIDQLRQGGARAVGNTLFYSEPQTDPGLQEIEAILAEFRNSALYRQGPDKPVEDLERSLLSARSRLDADGRLAAAYQRYPNVIQAFSLEPGYLRGRPDPVPDTLKSSQIPQDQELDVLPAQRIFPTIDVIAQHAAGQ
ncbi:MAG: CHASE2 domain-containing protein, partial [Candidatus Competibacterales bacterium]|nr:CHASE2 domain-containing protein [Candidatus Competibacterales bacterium]